MEFDKNRDTRAAMKEEKTVKRLNNVNLQKCHLPMTVGVLGSRAPENYRVNPGPSVSVRNLGTIVRDAIRAVVVHIIKLYAP